MSPGEPGKQNFDHHMSPPIAEIIPQVCCFADSATFLSKMYATMSQVKCICYNVEMDEKISSPKQVGQLLCLAVALLPQWVQ